MKSKRKIDTKAIQQFFIDHTEKIVIGAVGLMFLYFAYSAVTLQINDSYKKVPKDLEDAITTAKNTIQIGPRNKTPVAETPIPPYAEEIDTFKRPLDPDKYPFDKSIIVPPVGQRHPRGTPTIVAVQKLRAVAGRGALVGKEASTVGQRWIVVTGLFPYEDQLAEYKKMFQDANLHNDQHDIPEYIGFLVQRGEVVPGASEPVWEKWVIFSNSKTLDSRLQNWNGEGQEVVAAANTQPALTSPLPPLAINEWDDGVACPPEIGILSLQERNQNPGQVGGAAGMFAPNGQGRVRDRQIPPRGRGPAPGPAGQQQPGVDPSQDLRRRRGSGRRCQARRECEHGAGNAQILSSAVLRFRRRRGQAICLPRISNLEESQLQRGSKGIGGPESKPAAVSRTGHQAYSNRCQRQGRWLAVLGEGLVAGFQASEGIRRHAAAGRPCCRAGEAHPPNGGYRRRPHSPLGRKDGQQHARRSYRTISRHVAGCLEPDYDYARRPHERPRFYWLHIGRLDWR